MSYEDFYKTGFGKFVLLNEAGFVSRRMHGRLLSVGCGTGIIEEEIRKKGNEVICLEPSPEIIEYARKRIDVVEGYAEKMPFKEHSFDGVFFITSLEFVDDYRKAIEESYRVMKKNGILIIMMLNFSSNYFKKAYEKDGYIRKNIKHVDKEAITNYVRKFFYVNTSFFMCEDMNNECDAENKLLYVIEGRPLP